MDEGAVITNGRYYESTRKCWPVNSKERDVGIDGKIKLERISSKQDIMCELIWLRTEFSLQGILMKCRVPGERLLASQKMLSCVDIVDHNECLWGRQNNGLPQQIRLVIVSMSAIILLSEWFLYCTVDRDQHMLRNDTAGKVKHVVPTCICMGKYA